jgi:hypothetical protein
VEAGCVGWGHGRIRCRGHGLDANDAGGEEDDTLSIKHDIGVRSVETLCVKKIDEDFFSEE